jgi:hypothetical protein
VTLAAPTALAASQARAAITPLPSPSSATSSASGYGSGLSTQITSLEVVPPYWAALIQAEPNAVTVVRSATGVRYSLNLAKLSNPTILSSLRSTSSRSPLDNLSNPTECNEPPSVNICIPTGTNWSNEIVEELETNQGPLANDSLVINAQSVPGPLAFITSPNGVPTRAIFLQWASVFANRRSTLTSRAISLLRA